MFKKPTVFILGAGASWHYGYPTGEQLVREISSKAQQLGRYFDHAVEQPIGLMPKYVRDKISSVTSVGGNDHITWQNAWRASAGDCTELIRKLKSVDPLVIDYFLGQNSEIQTLGKMLIAWVIRECETDHHTTGGNKNRKKDDNPSGLGRDNWIRFIIHRLVVGCTNDVGVATNQVNFVTFNYDLSLEDTVANGLRNNSTFTHGGIRKFLDEDRFLHVYGKIRSEGNPDFVRLQPLKDPNRPQIDPRYAQTFIDDLTSLSEGIRTIDPQEKRDDELLVKIQELIKRAQCIYILGFGFDKNNCVRIGLEPGNFQNEPGKPRTSVMFTNFGNINRINKAASRAFFGYPDAFLDKQIVTANSMKHYYEKSAQNCYGALADDFDELEEY